jgi:hypothetical protein
MRWKCGEDLKVGLSVMVHEILHDFWWLASDLARHPTRITELALKKIPITLDAQGASGKGMGGVKIFPLPNGDVQPALWWCLFDKGIHWWLVIYANPAGVVTNSNLELAASLAQHDVLAQIFDIQEVMIHN